MKRYFGAWIGLYLGLMVGKELHSETLASYHLGALTSARSVREVEQIKATFDQLRTVGTACEIELAERVVPFSCYEWLQEVGSRSFADVNKPSVAELDRLCSAATSELRGLGPPTLATSSLCASKLREALSLKAYRDEDSRGWPKN